MVSHGGLFERLLNRFNSLYQSNVYLLITCLHIHVVVIIYLIIYNSASEREKIGHDWKYSVLQAVAGNPAFVSANPKVI